MNDMTEILKNQRQILKYIKEEGKKYNIDTKSMVISNTHDYKENNKNCNNCDFVHRYLYPTCMIKEGILKIRFPKTKAKYCKYYTTTNEDI